MRLGLLALADPIWSLRADSMIPLMPPALRPTVGQQTPAICAPTRLHARNSSACNARTGGTLRSITAKKTRKYNRQFLAGEAVPGAVGIGHQLPNYLNPNLEIWARPDNSSRATCRPQAIRSQGMRMTPCMTRRRSNTTAMYQVSCPLT